MTSSLRASSVLLIVAVVASTAACGSQPSSASAGVGPGSAPPAAVAPTPSPTGAATARMTLPDNKLRTGESMKGLITVENDTGRPIEIAGCGGIYRVTLVGPGEHPSVSWPLCLVPVTIPTGTSTYPVTVSATHDECAPTPNEKVRRCQADGAMPGLLPGRYKATPVGISDLLPSASPIAVTVTT